MTETRRVGGSVPKEGKAAAVVIPDRNQETVTDDLEHERISLERDRLLLERQKLAVETRLRRQELSSRRDKSWKELLANPLTLAIVGGFIGLMTTIYSNHDTQRANLRAEELKSRLAREASLRELQAELIKKFVESPKTETVRENLRFLIEAGLLPDYAEKITAYLAKNPETAPQVGQAGIGGFVGGVVGLDERVSLATVDPNTLARFAGEGAVHVPWGFCTGFLVAKMVVVTAKHCLAPQGLPGVSEKKLADSGATFSLLSSTPDKGVPLDFTRLVFVESSSESQEGVALVALSKPIDDGAQFLFLDVQPPILGQSFSMAFFSGEKASWLYSAGPDCRTMQIGEHDFRHFCDTGPGSSGAPLINSDGLVIGVHVANAPDGKHAVRADLIRHDPTVIKVFGQLPERDMARN